MNRLMISIACVALAFVAIQIEPALAAEKQSVIDVHGPTIVALFKPVTRAQLDRDPDTNEALADFQFYAAQVRGPLSRRGIEFRELSANSFQLRIGRRLKTFRLGNEGVGYYFVAPGKKPRFESGVMTDTDLLQKADEYFSVSAR